VPAVVHTVAMRLTCTIALAVGAAGLGGCLERDITITSEPAGALVRLNDVEVGRTPVTVPYKWHGDYDVMLRLDGYETISTHANINVPLHEVPPLDLLSELAPWTYHDRRYLHYKMSKLELPDDETLVQRAEQMRQENLKPVK